jgi:predicted amidohydrolase YtcJ
MRTHLATLILILIAFSGTVCSKDSAPATAPATGEGADLVIVNSKIFTAEETPKLAAAMAVRGGKIVYVGDESGAEAHIGANTEVNDLDGRLVLPGFHDVHQHTLEGNLELIDCLLDGEQVDPEAYASVVADCEPAAGTGWVLGWGHSIQTVMESKRAPRKILDEAQPDVPVAIMESTSHSTWVNTRALERLKIDAETSDPQGGIVLKDSNGEPNGILIDAAGEWPWEEALKPSPTLRTANLAALRQGLLRNSEAGITSAVDARTYVNRGYLDAYEEVEGKGEMTVRMIASLWASPVESDDEQIARLKALFRDDGGMLRVRQVKLYSDGLVQNTTGALIEPYTTTQLLGSDRGLSYFPEERITKYLRELHPAGFDFHIHAIGDRAVRESLNAVEAAAGIDARHRLTHVELVHPDDIKRFAALNVAADAQLGEHTNAGHDEGLVALIGPERASERAWRLRDLVNAGAMVALSTDFDVGPLNPFDGISRALELGEQSLPDVAAAVRAYTINGAWIMRSEERTGSLAPGKLADFVVVDRDIFGLAPAEIRKAKVLLTVLGGEVVHRDKSFSFAAEK